jgi:nucleoside-diphosphate-sugar epimerase
VPEITDIDKTKPVMVTGATGYVAGHIVRELLEHGLTVHAAVRSPENESKIAHLVHLANEIGGSIKFFKADLLDKGSYHEAMQDCEVVMHTASPFASVVNNPQKDLVDPAVLGTRNVLEEANKVESVKRIVLTSSCAAIYTDNIEVQSMPQKKLTEDLWNTTASLTHQPYFYSKVMAEKEAWKIAEQQKRWKLVVINPSLVIGPGIKAHQESESYKIIKQLGDGTMKGGVPDMGLGCVDVREVAKAHFNAAFMENASGRHILSAHNIKLMDLADSIRETYGDKYPLPKKTIPKFMVWLLGPILNKAFTRKIVSRNIGYQFVADNSKSREKLGINYRPLKESMSDFFKQLEENNAFTK